MQNKLKQILSQLHTPAMNQLRINIAEKYKISIDSVKYNWFYGPKGVPQDKMPEVLAMAKQVLEEQISRQLELINC